MASPRVWPVPVGHPPCKDNASLPFQKVLANKAGSCMCDVSTFNGGALIHMAEVNDNLNAYEGNVLATLFLDLAVAICVLSCPFFSSPDWPQCRRFSRRNLLV